MRIISGKLKGKSINFIKSSSTRPLKDSVKENIFNILTHSNKINVEIEKANILDLYSGIGSFGLECISRGAHNVTFVEKNKLATNILEKNLNELSITDQALIINDKIENFHNRGKKKYNIFFLDPPFADSEFINNLKKIKSNNMYEDKHIVIIHREKNTNDNFEGNIEILISKKYSRSEIIFGIFN